MVYHGPKFMEELVHYDPHLIVGVLGGSAGTTYDAFKLLAEARKHGARAALFGRKINHAEHQLAFIQFLRLIADGAIEPEEAVKAYHGVLQRLSLKPLDGSEDHFALFEVAERHDDQRAVVAAHRDALARDRHGGGLGFEVEPRRRTGGIELRQAQAAHRARRVDDDQLPRVGAEED